MIARALALGSSLSRICYALNLTPRTIQRWRKSCEDRRKGPKAHPRALAEAEKVELLKTLNSEAFCDLSPHVIEAKLADQGQYLASASTMYRLLRRNKLLVHRGRAKAPQQVPKLETIAKAPNRVWCWDITYLPGPVKGKPFLLYMVQDLFSRKIIDHCIATRESDTIATDLMMKCLKAENLSGQGLRLHNDNGNAMKSYMFREKLEDLGVMQTFSRPSVKDDNPFIEATFKTMKYRPLYPYRPFRSGDEAHKWVTNFVRWYNHDHLHSGIKYVTPMQKHLGEDIRILEQRRRIFMEAREKCPLRWSKPPKAWLPSCSARLNPAGCRLKRATSL